MANRDTHQTKYNILGLMQKQCHFGGLGFNTRNYLKDKKVKHHPSYVFQRYE